MRTEVFPVWAGPLNAQSSLRKIVGVGDGGDGVPRRTQAHMKLGRLEGGVWKD